MGFNCGDGRRSGQLMTFRPGAQFPGAWSAAIGTCALALESATTVIQAITDDLTAARYLRIECPARGGARAGLRSAPSRVGTEVESRLQYSILDGCAGLVVPARNGSA